LIVASYPETINEVIHADAEGQSEPRRRRFPRQNLRTLAYVTLDQGNGGIIRDLTESGMAVQAVAPLRVAQEVALRFELMSPRVRADVRGRVQWADANGQGGIEFIGVTPKLQRAMRDWLLIQMLATAVVSGRDSMFTAQADRELYFSSVARPAIALESLPFGIPADASDDAARVAWGWLSLKARNFAIFVDMLVLICAVLLFSISSIAVMGGVPAWPLAAILFIATSTIFGAVYQLLFSDLLCGASPGARLARLASGQSALDDDHQRFR
jgi:hypothetical protein